MKFIIEPLVSDLVAWCAVRPRTYVEALDAWRTSCPRLMVWEEAVERGYLTTEPGPSGLSVVVTDAGLDLVTAMLCRRHQVPRPPEAARPSAG